MQKQALEPIDKTLAAGGFLGPETFENLTSSGLLKLSGTNVRQCLQVNGSVIATASKIGSLKVIGDANLRDTIVSGETSVIGILRAQGTSFQGPLTLTCTKSVFTASKLTSLSIEKEEGFKGKQIIELKQKTIVDGSIDFASGKGEVHCYPGSQVLGSITGGKLVRKQ